MKNIFVIVCVFFIYNSYAQILNGHNYVDLGLPSGNLWSMEEAGTLAAGEKCTWGGNWEVPTEEDFQELNEYCSWTANHELAIWTITGPNGNKIELSALKRLPFCCGAASNDRHYWTSTQSGSTYKQFWVQIGAPNRRYSDAEHHYITTWNDKTTKHNIRPVIHNGINSIGDCRFNENNPLAELYSITGVKLYKEPIHGIYIKGGKKYVK